MSGNQITIKDLARMLDIAPSTVSRALKDHPDISDKTKRLVNDLAAKMNFHPNPIAVSLRGQKTFTIGVIIPRFVHYFFSTVISGIEQVAQEEGYHVLVCSSNESYEREVSASRILLNRRVDGLLISVAKDAKSDTHLEEYRKRNIPVVFFDCANDSFTGDKVIIDDYQAARDAVKHLLEQGCKSVAYLGGPRSLLINQQRFKGYQQALQESGIGLDQSLIFHLNDSSIEEGQQATRAFLEKDRVPEGIFGTADLLAIGAIKEIKAHGLKVPQDVALVGFSNWDISSLYEPSVTTVMQPGYEMGEAAIRMLLERIGNADGEPRTRILHTELLVRESSMRI